MKWHIGRVFIGASVGACKENYKDFLQVNLNTSQILQTPVENYLMVQKVFVLVLLKGSVKKKNVSNVTFSRMVYMKPNHVLDLIFTRLSQVLFAF